MQLINRMHSQMNVEITTQFAKIRFVSLTVDLWKDRRMRSFIGITAHFIDATLFQFKSLVLACKPIFGSHTGNKILTEYNSIINQYNIKLKIVRVNSDNGANVVKAYKLNMIQMQNELDEVENLDDPADINVSNENISKIYASDEDLNDHEYELDARDDEKCYAEAISDFGNISLNYSF